MREIQNHNLAQLLMQLKFTPAEKRHQQLDAAEKLFEIIDKNKEYPFEFVFFRITGFHPKDLPQLQPIKGGELADDLGIFISKLSGQVVQSVTEQDQKVYNIEELAEALNVSTKTIHRWRERALLAKKFVFDDGKKRLGFSQSIVDKFLKANPQLIYKAKKFARLTKKQKEQVVKRVIELAAKTKKSRYQIIKQIAAEIGKVHETVRYTILNYEKNNPNKRIFNKPTGVITTNQEYEICKLFKQGLDVKELMNRFNRSKSSIYRIINQRRARALLAKKVEFIASDEFLETGAKEKILAEPISSHKPIVGKSSKLLRLAGDSLPEYLQVLKVVPVLNREREVEFFRRYNYLKYLACITRAGIKPTHASSTQMKEIENYLDEAEAIKKMIIESNLRLVVSIAGKHVKRGANLPDLISEGNFSMMRAVEKFDYTRGFRFATYASWAIAKDYARKIPAETSRPDKAPTVSLANVQRDFRTKTTAGVVAVERARQSLIQVIKDDLNEREQYIILNHFGLIGPTVKKEKKTLKQIGDDLDLSKERVRQIELIALQKLKHSLDTKEFELLTG
ncbi:MAG: sigma-70 family RNA polymerase sigma factor [Planctomycetes bacterium]|nr:sigma-70 family RNA polymerase sigma factor [Planctomycetota bacterium]